MPASKYFPLLVHDLPKDDPRYIKWRRSLKHRPPPWCKGKTKETDASVRKISETFKRRRINNFAIWREKAREIGIIPKGYPPFKKDNTLAFLIGFTLGDGHIHSFLRTERLELVLGTDKPKLIEFVVNVVTTVFNKKPRIIRQKARAVKVSIYQKNIQTRLGIKAGNRRHLPVAIPRWIKRSRQKLIHCLRGLYEAEASLCIHLPTCTYNFSFSNKNTYLLNEVKSALISLGLHPETRLDAIRLRRRDEVKYFRDLINFRKYV